MRGMDNGRCGDHGAPRMQKNTALRWASLLQKRGKVSPEYQKTISAWVLLKDFRNKVAKTKESSLTIC